jgi:glycoprotein 3-alpha-L-fucosyltransferase
VSGTHSFKEGNSEQLKMIYKDKLNQFVDKGRTVFLNDECPINSCHIVLEGSKEDTPSIYYDAYVMSGVYLLDAHIKLKPNAVRIWYQLESPLNVACPKSGINWTATYRRSSTLHTPYEFFQPIKTVRFPQKTKTRNHAVGKTKMAAIFMSNCRAKNNRAALVTALQQHVGVDVFGECGPLKCSKISKISKECFQNMSRDYKFYLSFENSNCRDYITEKFFVNGLG